jgi:hypothetical protein
MLLRARDFFELGFLNQPHLHINSEFIHQVKNSVFSGKGHLCLETGQSFEALKQTFALKLSLVHQVEIRTNKNFLMGFNFIHSKIKYPSH